MEIYQILYLIILKKSYKCSKCKKKYKDKFSYEYIYNFFKEQNCELLSKEYINCDKKLKYKCSCGNKSEISFYMFKNDQRCLKCSNKERHTFEYVKNYFTEQNCELLETEYINDITKMKYICICKNESDIRFSSFQNGVRCNMCKNKTELKLLNWLKQTFSEFTINTQVKFDWCKNINHLPFDFLINELNLIIELDGKQHFEQVSNWTPIQEIKYRDNLKNKLALENNFKVIRICQRIVWDDKEFWDTQLKEAINNINEIELIKIGSVYN